MKFRCSDPACGAVVNRAQRGRGRVTSKPVWLCSECGSQLPRISDTKQGANA